MGNNCKLGLAAMIGNQQGVIHQQGYIVADIDTTQKLNNGLYARGTVHTGNISRVGIAILISVCVSYGRTRLLACDGHVREHDEASSGVTQDLHPPPRRDSPALPDPGTLNMRHM